jgi:phage terminase large subunit-like protein
MKITKEMLSSGPFQYAKGVKSGEIKTGKLIKLAVERFFKWIDEAEEQGFYLDHEAGMHIIKFFPSFINHTKGKLQGKPFHLQLFQQFTMYNVFAWKDATGKRRINTVYDKRAKKNGKSAEMAGLALYCMSFDLEMEAEVYVGATKEDQAKICWLQAKQFIDSPVANKALKKIGFRTFNKHIENVKTGSIMRPLGGDSKTQDGINSHLAIIDEYHAHKDDSVKENLESSSVMRSQPITWHITTAGVDIMGVCKQYEDSVKLVLNGQNKDDHLWIMIHDLDEEDQENWTNPENWYKANPLMQFGSYEMDSIMKEYIKAKNQPSKVPNFKTKHLNMWVDAPTVWIPREIWRQNIVEDIPMQAFQKFGSYAGVDLSTTTDITAVVFLSEPDEEDIRYLVPFLFCPADTIDHRSREDRVPYRYWADQGYIVATSGNQVDYDEVETYIKENYYKYHCKRVEFDKWNSHSMVNRLMDEDIQVSFFSQTIGNMSHPTKTFQSLIYKGHIKYLDNPVMEWMLSGCITIEDPNENVKIHKGKSNGTGKRVDGIVASIMALGGSLSIKEEASKYSRDLDPNEIYI